MLKYTTPTPIQIFLRSIDRMLVLLGLLYCGTGLATGQVTIAQQGFETTTPAPVWAIAAGSGNISTSTGGSDTPSSQRIRTGSRSWQVNNGTVSLDLSNVSTSGYTGMKVTLRISSTSTFQLFAADNGADATDRVRVFTALNGGAFPGTADITVSGNNNARWSFNNAQNATTSAGTPISVSGTSGTNQGTIYSTLIVNIPDGTTQVGLRVSANNDSGREVWNVDDVILEGIPCTPSVTASPSPLTICNGASGVLTASGATSYTWAPATGLSATTGSTVTASPGTSTTYTITGLAAGCPFPGTATVNVNVSVAPTVPSITPSSATTCAGSGQSLTASSTSSGTAASVFNSTGGPATVTNGAAQNASIYPWNLSVSGLPVSGVSVTSVTINGITHAFSDDLDILLQSATGTNVVLMSDIGGGNAISAVAYTFATGSPALADATANPTGTYSPTNIGATDDYPTAPGPGNGFSQSSPTLTSFTGNFNGTWKLLIRDDASGDAGSITSWSITFAVPATVSYTWTPNVALSSTTGATITASPTSTQTYTVTASHNVNGCTNSGTVTIATTTPPNAGSNNTLTICSNDAAADMGALLGAHDAGTWSGPSGVTGDLYDPATMSPGNYVYTVSAAPCPNAIATISVTENTAVNWYADTDGDGSGSGSSTGLACSAPNAGDVTNNTDQCPNDPNKIAPGQCGCGVPDTDTDGDGTANCNDGCPNDPNKIAPGVCGCGVADTDTDGDGTANCNDGCPNDANKIAPGICGCGVSDADTDNDGTEDCNDGCPSDPNKIAPGTCGCGVADTDTDVDLTADCIDGCPNDPNKIAPGQCGCGVPDTDTDSDGTADCNDGCPTDPNKITPGICGCGVADTDTDADGTADCNDGCPNDPNKVAPGVCGCGVSDVDTDLDGTADCNDGCPNDPLKIAPGICGCGVADTDTDGDATADCNDGCPNDPNKIAPGICGCGVADDDTDLDGTADCNDECPEDPNKIITGECGCGAVDTDTDGDLTADCNDNCPLDPNKVNPGACGCGNLETDTDGDTFADCVDGCPADPNKIAPGACGCGTADVDTDGDGALDCNDGCPNDPTKLAPGICGCGTSDIDTDGDGTADCNDNCPLVTGQVGTPCDDGNPGTMQDQLTANCTCTGTVVGHDMRLVLTTDNDAPQTSWEIIRQGGGLPECSGGGYAPNTTITIPCILTDGDYVLQVMDSFGDGMCCINGSGGYIFRTADGRRVIDNAANGIFASISSVSLGFHLPIGTDILTTSRCDREDYMPNEFIQATPSMAVQAQYGMGTQSDDGYQFWIFNPNGGYSRRVLLTHASNNYEFPTGADRCSYLKLSNITTNPVPHNMLLNVRVRSVVNGVYSEFGPACRMRIDLTNQCPTTQLINDQNNGNHSCGLTGVMLNGSRTLYAEPVSAANRYQFEFSRPGYLRKIASSSSSLVLTLWATSPLEYNRTYQVRVRVSYDNGASYCPFGSSCTMSTAAIAPAMTGGGRNLNSADEGESVMSAWPNPNHGEVVTIKVNGFTDPTTAVRLSIVDLFGKVVFVQDMTVEGELLNTTVDMSGFAAGVYITTVTSPAQTWTKRLVAQ